MDQKRAAEAAGRAYKEANLAIVRAGASPGRRLPNWAITAKPYLKAVRDNDYGLEDPVMCVLYALNNMTSWRGETARQVKAELNASIKEQVK